MLFKYQVVHLNPGILEYLGWLCIYKSSPVLLCRLAEKKATIGYTYEDSTVAEPDPPSDKDEDNSENSESEEDEGIPDIGEEMRLALMRKITTLVFKENRDIPGLI